MINPQVFKITGQSCIASSRKHVRNIEGGRKPNWRMVVSTGISSRGLSPLSSPLLVCARSRHPDNIVLFWVVVMGKCTRGGGLFLPSFCGSEPTAWRSCAIAEALVTNCTQMKREPLGSRARRPLGSLCLCLLDVCPCFYASWSVCMYTCRRPMCRRLRSTKKARALANTIESGRWFLGLLRGGVCV